MFDSRVTSTTRASRRAGAKWFAFLAVVALSSGLVAAPRATAWDFIYGNAGPDDYSRYMDVALAPDGGAYIAGFFAGSFQGLSSPNEYRYFLQRVSASGAIAWTREVPTPVLGGGQVPMRPQVVVDGLGNPFIQADLRIFAYSETGQMTHSILSPDNSYTAHMAPAPAGGFVIVAQTTRALERYDPDLSKQWSFDLTPYTDLGAAIMGKFGSTAVTDGTFWVVTTKFRALVTQTDATGMVHVDANGNKIASIKHFGFIPELMTDPNPIFGVSDASIMVTAQDVDNTTHRTIKVFAAGDGHLIGELPVTQPSHAVSSSKGAADCGAVDLIEQDRLEPGSTGDYVRTAVRKVVMNGTRLVVVSYCNSAAGGLPVPFVLSYSISGVGPNALTFLSARELTSATLMEAMDANDLGDEIVVGSATSTSVYVGGTRSLPRATGVRRALAAKNPLGSLFYGLRAANSVLELKVGGRGTVPSTAAGVALNVTAVGAKHSGTLKVYPCGSAKSGAVALTYPSGGTVANSAVSKLGKDGKVCIFTSQATHLTVDVSGHFPLGSSFVGRNPVRFLETRTGVLSTVDGKFFKLGERKAKSVTAVSVAGRGGVPVGARAAVMTMHVLSPRAAGVLIAYPCGTTRPSAANVTFAAGQSLSTTAIVRLGTGGKVCFYTTARAHLAADVSGHFVASTSFVPFTSRRLLDTRPAIGATVDGKFRRAGERKAKSVTQVLVRGRGGIPSTAVSVSLNVTVLSPKAAGSVTVYACGTSRPGTPNVFFTAGRTSSNAVVARVGTGGNVCLYTSAAAQLAVDVNGHFLGSKVYTPRPKPGRYVDTRLH